MPSVVRCDPSTEAPIIADPSPVNHLLSRLPAAEYQRLAGRMRLVTLDFKQVLHKYRERIEYVYFPIRGAVSAITIMEDGGA